MKNLKAQVTVQYNYPNQGGYLVGIYSNTSLNSVSHLLGDLMDRHTRGDINIHVITIKPQK